MQAASRRHPSAARGQDLSPASESPFLCCPRPAQVPPAWIQAQWAVRSLGNLPDAGGAHTAPPLPRSPAGPVCSLRVVRQLQKSGRLAADEVCEPRSPGYESSQPQPHCFPCSKNVCSSLSVLCVKQRGGPFPFLLHGSCCNRCECCSPLCRGCFIFEDRN